MSGDLQPWPPCCSRRLCARVVSTVASWGRRRCEGPESAVAALRAGRGGADEAEIEPVPSDRWRSIHCPPGCGTRGPAVLLMTAGGVPEREPGGSRGPAAAIWAHARRCPVYPSHAPQRRRECCGLGASCAWASDPWLPLLWRAASRGCRLPGSGLSPAVTIIRTRRSHSDVHPKAVLRADSGSVHPQGAYAEPDGGPRHPKRWRTSRLPRPPLAKIPGGHHGAHRSTGEPRAVPNGGSATSSET